MSIFKSIMGKGDKQATQQQPLPTTTETESRDERLLIESGIQLLQNRFGGHISNTMVSYLRTRPAAITFKEDAAYKRSQMLGNSRPCASSAVTDWTYEEQTSGPTITFNKSLYKSTTVLHELLHAFTHRAFRLAFRATTVPFDIEEGFTEYFTRTTLVGKLDKTKHTVEDKQAKILTQPARMNDKVMHYQFEATQVVYMREKLKELLPDEHVLRRAYFGGSEEAIRLIQQALKSVPSFQDILSEKPEWKDKILEAIKTK